MYFILSSLPYKFKPRQTDSNEEELHQISCWQIANCFDYAYMSVEIPHINVLETLIVFISLLYLVD